MFSTLSLVFIEYMGLFPWGKTGQITRVTIHPYVYLNGM
jgi:hypothetical protein